MSIITQISVIVLTKNEEVGLGETLAQLKDFKEVIVVDSHSTDATVDIAASHGARVVQFAWDGNYPKKKQWALDNAGAANPWVLLLDADEYPSPQLVAELRSLAPTLANAREGSFDLHLAYRFAGRVLRHGHVVTKRSLLHVERARFPEVGDLDVPGIREVEGHYQPRAELTGPPLRGRLLHDDRDPVGSWFDRHNRYSDWEAHLRLRGDTRARVAAERTAKGRAFDTVPFKPLAFFIYSYIARAGFLDGRAGLDYAIALSMYYWQIDVKYRELRSL